jgi:hopanoid biosynthesis associated RND transporter like protein HpnN
VATLAPEAGLRVRVTGDAALSAEEMERVADQAALAGLGSFLAVAALLWLALRSPYAVLAVLLTLITGLIWTAAFAALAIGHLNLVSVTFAVLFIGLGVDFGLHLAMRYLERLERGDSVHTALAHAAQSTGTSLVVCAITTAIGFYSFLPTPYSGVAELGAISGTGMLLSLVATLTLLPALLVLAPAARRGSRAPDAHGPGSDASWPARNARPVLIASGIAALAGLALLPAIRFDANPLAVRDPGAESVQTMQDLLATSRLSPWPIELLAADEATAHDLASRLGSLPQVERTVTVAEFVPGEQVEKLEILRDVTLFMGELDVAPTSPVDVDATLDALRRLRGALTRYEREAGTRLAESARTLDAAIADVIDRTEAAADPGADLGQLQERVLGRLRGIVVWLAQALDPPPTSIDDLPADLRSRYVAADGRLRLQVFPAVDLGDSEGLIAFVDAVREIVPEAGGSAVTIVESGRAIVSSLRMAMTGALLAITLLLLALWRSLALAALVVGPLLLAALLTISGAVLAGLPLNFANVIVIPLLLGMGVDSGIHLVRRFTGGDGSGDLLRTSTARAVLFSALTTVASFGTLGLASHRGMASLGQLLALGMGFVLVANLIVLPALLQVLRKRL